MAIIVAIKYNVTDGNITMKITLDVALGISRKNSEEGFFNSFIKSLNNLFHISYFKYNANL